MRGGDLTKIRFHPSSTISLLNLLILKKKVRTFVALNPMYMVFLQPCVLLKAVDLLSLTKEVITLVPMFHLMRLASFFESNPYLHLIVLALFLLVMH